MRRDKYRRSNRCEYHSGGNHVLHAVIAKVYNKSEADCLELLGWDRSTRLCENNSKALEAGDCGKCRGYG